MTITLPTFTPDMSDKHAVQHARSVMRSLADMTNGNPATRGQCRYLGRLIGAGRLDASAYGIRPDGLTYGVARKAIAALAGDDGRPVRVHAPAPVDAAPCAPSTPARAKPRASALFAGKPPAIARTASPAATHFAPDDKHGKRVARLIANTPGGWRLNEADTRRLVTMSSYTPAGSTMKLNVRNLAKDAAHRVLVGFYREALGNDGAYVHPYRCRPGMVDLGDAGLREEAIRLANEDHAKRREEDNRLATLRAERAAIDIPAIVRAAVAADEHAGLIVDEYADRVLAAATKVADSEEKQWGSLHAVTHAAAANAARAAGLNAFMANKGPDPDKDALCATPVDEPAIAAFLNWLEGDHWQAEKARGSRAVSKFSSWAFAPAKAAIGVWIDMHRQSGGWACDTDYDAIRAARLWVRWRAANNGGRQAMPTGKRSFAAGYTRKLPDSYTVTLTVDGKTVTANTDEPKAYAALLERIVA